RQFRWPGRAGASVRGSAHHGAPTALAEGRAQLMRAKPVEVTLDPVDNQRLARVCGALDENLRQIESALDVTIARRGAKFTGRGEHAARAAQAIEHFYDRATGDLTMDDVQLSLTELSRAK